MDEATFEYHEAGAREVRDCIGRMLQLCLA
jgi:hypothetical protein